MYWQQEAETLLRPMLENYQLVKLKETVGRCYYALPHYRKKFDEAGISPDDIQTLDDIVKIPFTVKNELRDNYPFGLFAVPMGDVVRVHASSGTTGKPTVVGYTKRDLDTWSDMVARVVVAGGGRSSDIVQIAFGYGLFTGAFGLHYGLERLGATIVPTSTGNTERQLMLMQDFGATALVATPSYALYLSEVARERGIADKLKLRVGFFGSEGCTVEMRTMIEENLGVFATDNYGMSELVGPGVAGECELRQGMHIWEDCFIPEIIDTETGEVLPEGEVGELVITPLFKEAMPILRYRTGDITRLNYEPCACGRTHVRMDKVMGRTDDMLIIKGVNVFPSQIESALLEVKGVGPHYLLVVRRENFMDTLEVQVEMADPSMLERFAELQNLERAVRHQLQTVLGLDAKVRLVDQGSIERFQGKAKRVIDLRNESQV